MRALTFQKPGDYNSRQGEIIECRNSECNMECACSARTVDGLESVADPEVMKREASSAGGISHYENTVFKLKKTVLVGN